MKIDDRKERLKNFLILSILGLLLINVSLVSSYIILVKFGTLTLSPGEKYTINIPFIGPSKSPVICGKAQQTDGTLLENVKVVVKYYDNETTLAQNTTTKDGKFCIKLPEITTNKKFDVYVEYDNETLSLGSNDYQLGFNNNEVYAKGIDRYAFLSGNITNQDASVENGRFEINLKYYNETGELIEIFSYKKYLLNIEPNQIYGLPNPELNVSWPIDENTPVGRYKFYIKTSFNAKERTSNIYFNITE